MSSFCYIRLWLVCLWWCYHGLLLPCNGQFQRWGGNGGDEIYRLIGTDTSLFAVGTFQQHSTFIHRRYTARGQGDIIFFHQNPQTGRLHWAHSLGSSANDLLYDAVCDEQANLYILGHCSQPLWEDSLTVPIISPPRPALFLIKYNRQGKRLWAKTIPCTAKVEGKDLHWGADGKLYLTGTFQDTLWVSDAAPLVAVKGRHTVFVIACNTANGLIEWTAQPHWAQGLEAVGTAIAADAQGNVYVGGHFSGKMAFLPSDTFVANPVYTDIFLASLSPKGAWRWAKHFDGVYSDRCKALLLDAQQRLWMGGELVGVLQLDSLRLMTAFRFPDIFVAQFSTSGGPLRAWQSLGDGDAFVESLWYKPPYLWVGGFFRGVLEWQGTDTIPKGGMDAFCIRLETEIPYNHAIHTFGGEGNDLLRTIWQSNRGDVWLGGSFQKKLCLSTDSLEAAGFSDGFWGKQIIFPQNKR